MTRIARKSDSPATNCAAKSSANVSRYWARARIEAPASRREVGSCASRSATLHHQPPNGRRRQQTAPREKGRSPRRLEDEGAEQVEAETLPQEDVDWDLKDSRERKSLEHCARALWQEVERNDEACEERPRQGGHVENPAIVE